MEQYKIVVRVVATKKNDSRTTKKEGNETMEPLGNTVNYPESYQSRKSREMVSAMATGACDQTQRLGLS